MSAPVVYAIVDALGMPRYVGQTQKRLSVRLAQHQRFARAGTRPLDAWLRDAVGVTIVPLVSNPEDADAEERKWIAQMRAARLPILNLADGGRRAPTGLKHTDAARAKMSKALKGKPLSPATREKLSAAHRGVPLSDEHRAAIGRGGRGLTRSPKARLSLSASKTGDLNPMSRAKRAERAARAARGGDAL